MTSVWPGVAGFVGKKATHSSASHTISADLSSPRAIAQKGQFESAESARWFTSAETGPRRVSALEVLTDGDGFLDPILEILLDVVVDARAGRIRRVVSLHDLGKVLLALAQR